MIKLRSHQGADDTQWAEHTGLQQPSHFQVFYTTPVVQSSYLESILETFTNSPSQYFYRHQADTVRLMLEKQGEHCQKYSHIGVYLQLRFSNSMVSNSFGCLTKLGKELITQQMRTCILCYLSLGPVAGLHSQILPIDIRKQVHLCG